MDSISDDELIDRIATVSVQSIRLQRAYRYRPLWQPALAKETTDKILTGWRPGAADCAGAFTLR